MSGNGTQASGGGGGGGGDQPAPPAGAPAAESNQQSGSGGGGAASSGGDNNPSSAKRHATVGQWRTPPVPFFPSTSSPTNGNGGGGGDAGSGGAAAAAGGQGAGAGGAPDPATATPDDYAAALQEAYRRGAEAGAAGADPHHAHAASHHAHHAHEPLLSPLPDFDVDQLVGIPSPTNIEHPNALGSAVSCPDFQNVQGGAGAAQQQGGVPPPIGEEPDPQMVAAHQSAAAAQAAAYPGLPASSSSPSRGVPSPLPPMQVHQQAPPGAQQPQPQRPQMQHPGQMVGQPHQQQAHPYPTTAGYAHPNAPQYHPQQHPQQQQARAPAPSGGRQRGGVRHSVQQRGGQAPSGHQDNSNQAGRSVSLPDITSYAAQADAEEAKRRKRLARNRASARLRRLRKKNLVDSYEGEVGVLESSLAKLRAHRWGVGSDHEALLEALSMDRGQQNIDADKRRELIRSILEQQRDQVQNIRECQLENMVLGWIARYDDGANGGGEAKVKVEADQRGTGGDEKKQADEEEAELARELNDLLQLTPEQKAQLANSTEGLEEERKAIETVDACLEAMMSNSWLMNAGVEECTEQFMSILNPGQTSKFLLWTDHNSEAIDQLDYVRAPPASAQPAQGPVFVFGMDEGGQQGDDPSEGAQQF